MKLRGSSSNGGQNRKDKSIDGENDVNVEVTVQKRISATGGNGNENVTETVRRESVKLGQREGRKNKKRNGKKRRKGGLKAEYCMDEEVKSSIFKSYHSSEIRCLCLMKCPRKMLLNLPYF